MGSGGYRYTYTLYHLPGPGLGLRAARPGLALQRPSASGGGDLEGSRAPRKTPRSPLRASFKGDTGLYPMVPLEACSYIPLIRPLSSGNVIRINLKTGLENLRWVYVAVSPRFPLKGSLQGDIGPYQSHIRLL